MHECLQQLAHLLPVLGRRDVEYGEPDDLRRGQDARVAVQDARVAVQDARVAVQDARVAVQDARVAVPQDARVAVPLRLQVVTSLALGKPRLLAKVELQSRKLPSTAA
jgi:hypothetical protein